MSIAAMILGQSGTGKSASLRNLPPEQTLLIQVVKKPLPFRSGAWKPCTKSDPTGSIIATDNYMTIVGAMQRTKKPIIVIDDFQYLMCNEFMLRCEERGFDKFTEIARHAWDVLMTATKRVTGGCWGCFQPNCIALHGKALHRRATQGIA